MRNIYPRVLLCVATGLWLVLLPVFSYGQKRGHAQMLSRPVPSLPGSNLPAIEALLRLAQEQHIPLGIDYLDATAVQKPITVSQAPANVADAIGAILANLRGYRWDLHNGVVHITHTVPRGERNLLDFVLPRF